MAFASRVARLEQMGAYWVALRDDGRYFRLGQKAGAQLQETLAELSSGAMFSDNQHSHLAIFVSVGLISTATSTTDEDLQPLPAHASTQPSTPYVWPIIPKEAMHRLAAWIASKLPRSAINLATIGALVWWGLVVFEAFLSHSNSISWSNPSLYTVLFAVAIYAISIVIHEMGHAVECFREVSSVGSLRLGFISAMPAIMTDTSACYFADRSGRLRVAFAGAQYQLVFVASSAALFGSSSVQTTLAVLMTVVLWMVLVPFMRNDGYWALADLRDEPNPVKNAALRLISGQLRRGDGLVVALVVAAFVGTWFVALLALSNQLQILWSSTLDNKPGGRLWLPALSAVLMVIGIVLGFTNAVRAWRQNLFEVRKCLAVRSSQR